MALRRRPFAPVSDVRRRGNAPGVAPKIGLWHGGLGDSQPSGRLIDGMSWGMLLLDQTLLDQTLGSTASNSAAASSPESIASAIIGSRPVSTPA